MITRESLGIFWDDGNGQEEADGIIFYGFWQDDIPSSLDVESFKEIWKDTGVQLRIRKWDTSDYKTYSIEVLLLEWPRYDSDWDILLKKSMTWFIKNGAVISWCGDEFSNPDPEIFNPQKNIGAVYAAFTPKVGMICNSKLSGEFVHLSDKQLAEVFSTATT